MRLAIQTKVSHIVHLEECIEYMNGLLDKVDEASASVIRRNIAIAELDLTRSREDLKCRIGHKATINLSKNSSEAK